MPGHCRGCCGVGWREATVDCRLGALHGGWSGVNMPMGGGRGSASAMLALAALLLAHGAPIIGTVTAVTNDNFTIKDKDNKSVVIGVESRRIDAECIGIQR